MLFTPVAHAMQVAVSLMHLERVEEALRGRFTANEGEELAGIVQEPADVEGTAGGESAVDASAPSERPSHTLDPTAISQASLGAQESGEAAAAAAASAFEGEGTLPVESSTPMNIQEEGGGLVGDVAARALSIGSLNMGMTAQSMDLADLLADMGTDISMDDIDLEFDLSAIIAGTDGAAEAGSGAAPTADGQSSQAVDNGDGGPMQLG